MTPHVHKSNDRIARSSHIKLLRVNTQSCDYDESINIIHYNYNNK